MSDPAPSLAAAQPADAEEAALWNALRETGSLAARERLFSRYTGFARNIARRHYREQSSGDIELADLVQLAFAGLLEALDKYDPARGAPFRPFAAHRISGSVRDGLVKMSELREQIAWRRRVQRERLRSLAEDGATKSSTSEAMAAMADIAVGLALGFMLEDTGLFDPHETERDAKSRDATAYDSLAWKEMVGQLHAAVAELPEREQLILRRHYLDGVGFDQLAQLLQITKGRVSQLHRSALLLLKKRMRERGHFRLEK